MSHKPGVEVVLEAYTGDWRRVPDIERVAKHTITDVWMSPWPSYEDATLKSP